MALGWSPLGVKFDFEHEFLRDSRKTLARADPFSRSRAVNPGGSRSNLSRQGRNFIVNKKSVFCQKQNGISGLLVVVIVIATVLGRYRLDLTADAILEPFASLTVRPKHGVKVRLAKR
jgi:hypothetical protein